MFYMIFKELNYMNLNQKEYFLDEISKNKSQYTGVGHNELLKFAVKKEIVIPTSISKNNLIEMITSSGYLVDLYDLYSNQILVSERYVALTYGISVEVLDEMIFNRIIKEKCIKEKIIQNEYHPTKFYSLNILEYSEKQISDEHSVLFAGEIITLKFETKTKREAENLVIEISKVYKIRAIEYTPIWPVYGQYNFTIEIKIDLLDLEDNNITNNLLNENNLLQAENIELKKRIDNIESDNIKLIRKNLRSQNNIERKEEVGIICSEIDLLLDELKRGYI